MGGGGERESVGGEREVSKEVYFHFKEHMCNNGTNILRFGAKTIFCMNFYFRPLLLLFFFQLIPRRQNHQTRELINARKTSYKCK